MKRTIHFFFRLLLVGVLSTSLFGQTETGQVSGTITDPTGAVVAGTEVTLRNVATGATRTATTTDTGFYSFTNLQPGTYEVVAQAPNFAAFRRQVNVTVGSRNTVNAQLAVTEVGVVVEVTGEGIAQVNTETQTTSTVISGEQITGLSTLDRNPYDLVLTAGNVASGDYPGEIAITGGAAWRGTGVAVSGNRAANTNVLLDGGENVDLFTATIGQAVPLDSVQEFRLVTNNFTAEYGRAGGAVVNVATRAGTNNFHGSAHWMNRISALTTNTFENNARDIEKPRFTRNQFGYSIGGPVVRDRVFFFNATEWTRVRSIANQVLLIPTPELIAASSADTQAFFQAFGEVQHPINGRVLTVGELVAGGQTTPGGAFATLPAGMPAFGESIFGVAANAGGGDPQNTYSTVGRLDFNFTDRTSLYGRYALESTDLLPGTISFSPYTGYDTGSETFNQNAMLNLTHVFTPSFVSQTKAVYNRLNLQQPLGEREPGPTGYLTSAFTTRIEGVSVALPGYLPLSPGSAIPFGGPQNLYQIYQDFNWTAGRHQFRFGGSYIHTRDNRVFGAFQNSVQNFGLNIQQGLDNFVQGALFQFQGAIDPQGAFPCVTDPTTGLPVQTPDCLVDLPVGPPNFGRNNRYNDFAWYIQDSWRAHPRLKLNLGVRWEYYGVQHNRDPLLDSNFYYGEGATFFEQIRNGQVLLAPESPVDGVWEQDFNNIAPRVGFAWDVFGDGRTSLRGGYGIGYERNFGNVTFNIIQNPPNYAVISLRDGVDVPPGTLRVTTDNFGPLGGTTPPQVALPRTSLRHIDQNLRTAYVQQWGLSVEREMFRNGVLSLDYTGNRGLHLYSLEDPNRPGTGVIYGGDDPAVVGLERLNLQYSNLNTRRNAGFSHYHGLNVGFRAANLADWGLQFTANYTWSHAIDNLSSTFSESSNNFNLGLLDPFNPRLDKGPADFDIRHRFVFSGLWELPFLRGDDPGVLRNVLGGWRVSPAFTVRTGAPFTVWDCTNGFFVCARMFPAEQADIPRGGLGLDAPAVAGVPNLFNFFTYDADIGAYINPLLGVSDFGLCTTPGEGAQGPCLFPENMTGRNAFRGPGFWNFDLGVSKDFRVTEEVGLEVRGDFFNILNHSNLWVDTAGTEVNNLHPELGVPFVPAKRGGFGTAFDERRTIQLGARFTF